MERSQRKEKGEREIEREGSLQREKEKGQKFFSRDPKTLYIYIYNIICIYIRKESERARV